MTTSNITAICMGILFGVVLAACARPDSGIQSENRWVRYDDYALTAHYRAAAMVWCTPWANFGYIAWNAPTAEAAVNKAIEDARNQKVVKANLAADATLYVSDELQSLLSRLGDELRFVTITSTATLKPLAQAPADLPVSTLSGLKVAIIASGHSKCSRCWHHREDVGSHASHPELCGRCIDNVDGGGEVRRYA